MRFLKSFKKKKEAAEKRGKIIFIGGFDIQKNKYIATVLKNHFKNNNELSIILEESFCVSGIKKHSYRQKHSFEPLNNIEYLMITKRYENEQFVETIKHLKEQNIEYNIIAVGNLVDLLGDKNILESLEDFVKIYNVDLKLLFVERKKIDNAEIRFHRAREHYEKKLDTIYSNNVIEKIYQEQLAQIV